MSPVAAVVIFSSTLVGCTPMQIVRRTGAPLVVGFVAVLLALAALASPRLSELRAFPTHRPLLQTPRICGVMEYAGR
jgi:hypothetical protein